MRVIPSQTPRDGSQKDFERGDTFDRVADHENAPAARYPRWRRWLRPLLIERVMMVADALLIICCGPLSAWSYHWYADAGPVQTTSYTGAAMLVATNFVLVMSLQHAYRITIASHPLRQLRVAGATWAGVFAVLLATGFLMKISQEFSRGAIILFFISGLFVVFGSKACAAILIAQARRHGMFTNSRVVVVAEQGLAAPSSALRELRRQGYRPSRILDIPANDLMSPLALTAIETRMNALIGYCREYRIELVFVLVSWNRQHVIDAILESLRALPIPVHLIPDTNVSRFLKCRAVRAGDVWMAELRPAPLSHGQRRLKRALDLLGAVSALVVFTPVMIAAAILIKLDSKGPVLFRQTRNGFNGHSFRILKFRTMTVVEDGAQLVQATKNDARVTRIGRWLRKTSIDELPQLLNVIQGDMSLVGPRPHAAAHNTKYEQVIGNYAFRHHVKPGITGWAQVNGYRGETRAIALMEKRVELDLWYINNWSFWLDTLIVLKTVTVSFRHADVY